MDVNREEVLRAQDVLGVLVRDAGGGDFGEDLVRAAVLPDDVSRHQPDGRPACTRSQLSVLLLAFLLNIDHTSCEPF